MDKINEWFEYFKHHEGRTVRHTQRVQGLYKKVFAGGRTIFAGVGMEISPSDQLSFSTDLSEEEQLIIGNAEYFESICMGVLDVLLVQPPIPVKRFACRIDKIEYHEIDSSPRAFRLAARDAAEKFLKED